MDLQHQEKPKQNQSQQTYKSQKNLTSDSEQNSTIPNTHFRVNSITQLQDKANQSAKVKSFEKLQSNANYSDALSQLQAFDKGLNKTTNSRTEPIQRNNTGIPDHLKLNVKDLEDENEKTITPYVYIDYNTDSVELAKNMDYKTIFIVLFTFIVNLVIYACVLNYIFNKVIN